MGEAVNYVENIFVVVLDFKIAAGHLCDTMINCLVSIFKYACLRSNIASLDSESSSLEPIWTLDGDSVSTVGPGGNLIDLYIGGSGRENNVGILG